MTFKMTIRGPETWPVDIFFPILRNCFLLSSHCSRGSLFTASQCCFFFLSLSPLSSSYCSRVGLSQTNTSLTLLFKRPEHHDGSAGGGPARTHRYINMCSFVQHCLSLLVVSAAVETHRRSRLISTQHAHTETTPCMRLTHPLQTMLSFISPASSASAFDVGYPGVSGI